MARIIQAYMDKSKIYIFTSDLIVSNIKIRHDLCHPGVIIDF